MRKLFSCLLLTCCLLPLTGASGCKGSDPNKDKPPPPKDVGPK